MAERRVLFRDGDNPLYLSGYRESDSHIRGRVENGNYNVLFNKRPDLPEGSLWQVHHCTALRSCSESNLIGHCDPKTLVIIDVPDTVLGDYNVIIEWARRRINNEG